MCLKRTSHKQCEHKKHCMESWDYEKKQWTTFQVTFTGFLRNFEYKLQNSKPFPDLNFSKWHTQAKYRQYND